ncbi:hypothetical protein [Nocardioides sp. B-3]|uniref:hypothetical protein n=1 Tax=Nocardioides sp. B-3 TaxID=2895565 RepID=UPI003FA5C785
MYDAIVIGGGPAGLRGHPDPRSHAPTDPDARLGRLPQRTGRRHAQHHHQRRPRPRGVQVDRARRACGVRRRRDPRRRGDDRRATGRRHLRGDAGRGLRRDSRGTSCSRPGCAT